MKQIIQSYRTGELWLGEVPSPQVLPGTVLVETATSLVSAGTERAIVDLARKSLVGKARARPDLVKKVLKKLKTEGVAQTASKVFERLDTPIPLGYSCTGIVVEVGEGVEDLSPGDRVACAGAGYANHAERNVVPRNLCVPLPEDVSMDAGAYATVGAIALQGIRQAQPQIGERVVVIGLGLLGLLTVQMLRAAGCVVIGTDLDHRRCQLARELGAKRAVDDGIQDAVDAVTAGRGADAVIITAATPSNGPIELAAELSRMRGRVVAVGMVGLEVPRDAFYRKELDLRMSMSYGPGRYDAEYEERGHDYPFDLVRWTEQRNMQCFVELLADGSVDTAKLTTHDFACDNALDAYALLEGAAGSYLGILIRYEGGRDRPRTLRPSTAQRAHHGPTSGRGLALVGAGNYARSVLLPALKRSSWWRLVSVCTATGMSGSQTAEKHGFEFATTNATEAIEHPGVDVVLVATRHDSHAALALEARRAGKHVFVEKPLCIREEDLETLAGAFGEPGPCLMVGYNRRFSPHALAMHEAFAQRTMPLTITYRINAGVVPSDSWLHDPQLGGGRILGEVCHFVDLCEYLVDSPAARVVASSVSSQDARVTAPDNVVANITYADGSLATIQYFAHGSGELEKERFEVSADGRSAVCEDFRRTEFHGGDSKPVRGSQDKGVSGELQAFTDAVRSGGQPPITLDSLIRTSRVTFAIRESLRTGASVAIPH